jgi:hypothetical protein
MKKLENILFNINPTRLQSMRKLGRWLRGFFFVGLLNL